MKFHVISRCDASDLPAEYSVTVSDAQVTIAHANKDDGITITASDLAMAGNTLVVHFSSVYGFITSCNEDLINDKSQLAYLQYARNVEKNVCAIICNKENLDEAALVFSAQLQCNVDVIKTGVSGPVANALELVFPGIKNRRASFRDAKVDLLVRTNAHDSIAALEKQVDLLSELVILLAQKQPSSDLPAWFEDFKAILAQQSALQFKGEAGSIDEVLRRKSAMRASQRAYFEKRGY